MEVTPSMAARWLEGNTHNRPVNNGHVERLASEMKAGRWRLTHQGVAFSPGGRLLDGQHRLWAIVMADVPVKTRVFFNEPAENIEYYDGGLIRNNADRMSLSKRFGKAFRPSRPTAAMKIRLAQARTCITRSTGRFTTVVRQRRAR